MRRTAVILAVVILSACVGQAPTPAPSEQPLTPLDQRPTASVCDDLVPHFEPAQQRHHRVLIVPLWVCPL